jgi:hypothetical protein
LIGFRFRFGFTSISKDGDEVDIWDIDTHPELDPEPYYN